MFLFSIKDNELVDIKHAFIIIKTCSSSPNQSNIQQFEFIQTCGYGELIYYTNLINRMFIFFVDFYYVIIHSSYIYFNKCIIHYGM